MNRLCGAILIAILMSVSVPVLAQPGPPPPPHPGGGPMHLEFALRGLNLTTDQTAQIDALMSTHRGAAEAARTAGDDARRALVDQIQAAAFDEGAIRAKAAAVAALEADCAVAEAALLRDVRALLSPEQLTKFNSRLAPPPPPAPPKDGQTR